MNEPIKPQTRSCQASGAIDLVVAMKGFAELKAILSCRSRRQTLSARLNHLSLWLGRLVIAFNNLEHALAYEISFELIVMIRGEESSSKHPLGLISPVQRRIASQVAG